MSNPIITEKNIVEKYPYLSDWILPKKDVSKFITGPNEIKNRMKKKENNFILLRVFFLFLW